MDLRAIIEQTAAKYGLDPAMMLRIAQIESGMNPNTANPRSSARGVYQFLTKPGGSWEQYGQGKSVFDPHANVDAGARYIRDNMSALEAKLGRKPAPWEVYFAHQQGPAGGPALLQNPNRPAAEVLSAFYKNPETARQAIALNAGNPDAPAQDFANVWKAKYEGTAVPSGGGNRAGAVAIAGDPNAAVVTNPNALAFGQQNALGSIFADALAPLAQKPIDPLALVRKPKSVASIVGELGAPVELSA